MLPFLSKLSFVEMEMLLNTMEDFPINVLEFYVGYFVNPFHISPVLAVGGEKVKLAGIKQLSFLYYYFLIYKLSNFHVYFNIRKTTEC